jgi:excisionase family DNA binding protein
MQPDTTPRPLMNLAEVAERLGVNQRHVRRLVAERRVPYLKWGHLLRFDTPPNSRPGSTALATGESREHPLRSPMPADPPAVVSACGGFKGGGGGAVSRDRCAQCGAAGLAVGAESARSGRVGGLLHPPGDLGLRPREPHQVSGRLGRCHGPQHHALRRRERRAWEYADPLACRLHALATRRRYRGSRLRRIPGSETMGPGAVAGRTNRRRPIDKLATAAAAGGGDC